MNSDAKGGSETLETVTFSSPKDVNQQGRTYPRREARMFWKRYELGLLAKHPHYTR
jgi:hypothetical protein